MLVEGEAGIGKSELVRAGAGIARTRGLQVFSARAAELECEIAFGVARQLFARPVRPDWAALHVDAAALAAPVLSNLDHPVDTGSNAFAVLHGLYWLTAAIATERPTLLTIDDGQWCDLPSLRFVAYLAGRMEGLRLGILLAVRPDEFGARPDETSAGHDLLRRIAAEPHTAVARPSPLSADAVHAWSGPSSVVTPTAASVPCAGRRPAGTPSC